MSNYNNNNTIIIISRSVNNNNTTTTKYIKRYTLCSCLFLQFDPVNYNLLNSNNYSQ